ncbi:MAG: hypothetical protein ACRCZZ_05665, partial [Phocaeicola sp.]
MRTTKLVEKIVTDGVSKTGFTVYHRTGKSSDPQECMTVIKDIFKSGFKAGNGALYGKGLYATTDRKSSFDYNNVRAYGLGLIKYVVPKTGILILDYNISGIVYGTGKGKTGHPAYSIVNQLVENGIYQNEASVPDVFKALSYDLEDSFGSGRKLSADRAYNIIYSHCIEGKPLDTCTKNFTVQRESISLYSYCRGKVSKFSSHPKVNGIIFSGNHDGNVLVLYKFSKIKPLMWGVSDPSDPTNPNKWAVPMRPVGKEIQASGLGDMATDISYDLGVVSSKGSADSIWIQGLTQDNLFILPKSIPTVAPWLKDNRNSFNALDAYLPSSAGSPSVILAGHWEGGIFSGYFGNDSICLSNAEKLYGGKIPKSFNTPPEWNFGNFMGGYFCGAFKGGVFKGGTFNGVFLGGLWRHSDSAVWGDKAVFSPNRNSTIEYDGAIFPLDSDPIT